jgi:hypothetical protein
LPQKANFGMLEVHNISNLVIDNAWVSCDKSKSESFHKNEVNV